MIRVWKAVIQPNSTKDQYHAIQVKTKKGAWPISVGKQGDSVCVWFEVDDKEKKEEDMILYCVGTGFGQVPEPEVAQFFGTVVDGPYVWHFYRTH